MVGIEKWRLQQRDCPGFSPDSLFITSTVNQLRCKVSTFSVNNKVFERSFLGQQHCCWESLRDYSLVKLKLQPSQTELLFRSVDDSFLAMRTRGRSHCTTLDADPFELSVSCVGVVPSLAPAEFCTTLSSQRHQNVFEKPKASPLNHRCLP